MGSHPMPDNVHHLRAPFSGRSIQGEQQAGQMALTFMDQGDVDEYVDKVAESVLACRERGRHLYPPMKTAGLVFTGVTDDGLLIRRLECMCCHLVDRVEYWETRGTGKNRRYRPVAARPDYKTGPNGERYLAKAGKGRMTAKMVRESIATSVLAGTTPTQLIKEIKEREARQREAAKDREAKRQAG